MTFAAAIAAPALGIARGAIEARTQRIQEAVGSGTANERDGVRVVRKHWRREE